MPVWENVPLYGLSSDTGKLVVRSTCSYAMQGELLDPSTVEIRVEIWTSKAFGPSQNRCHAMEVYVPAPMSEAKYEDAYRRILGEYEPYWKELGVIPERDWKEELALRVGRAVQHFVNQTKTLN